MNLNLDNKRAIISGACRGIGLTTARMLLDEGVSVCISGRDQRNLDLVYEQLNESKTNKHGEVLTFCGDLTEKDEVVRFVSFIHDRWSSVDIVISNIGNGKPDANNPLELSEWHRLFKINLDSAVLISNAFLPDLRKSHGSLIMISSIVAKQVFGNSYAYAASKSSVISLVKYLASDEGKNGVRVNCVAPGNIFFDGGRWEEILREKKEQSEVFKKSVLDAVPMGRFGMPEDVAAMVLFLSSPVASFITGQCIMVDGGQVSGL